MSFPIFLHSLYRYQGGVPITLRPTLKWKVKRYLKKPYFNSLTVSVLNNFLFFSKICYGFKFFLQFVIFGRPFFLSFYLSTYLPIYIKKKIKKVSSGPLGEFDMLKYKVGLFGQAWR